jgi:hypothetical protein
MEVPARPVKAPVNVPTNQIERFNAIMMFRAASGLGIYDSKQLIDINFPRHQQPQQHTLYMLEFRDFVQAWREANLRAFV